jgi:hypothetical protein
LYHSSNTGKRESISQEEEQHYQELEEKRRKSHLKLATIRRQPTIAFNPPTVDTIDVAPAEDGECINAPLLDMPLLGTVCNP